MLLAFAAAGCASQARETAPTPTPAPAPPASPPPELEGEAPAEQPAPPAPLPAGLGPVAGPMLLPPAPGQIRISLEGCVASASTEEEGAKFPVPAPTRSLAPPPVTVAISGLGVLVSHRLTHACCLKAEVTSAVKDGSVTVTEKLSGKACRCMCGSTIRTAVGLAPGAYDLAVRLEPASGEASVVHQQQVEVKALRK